jgi:hypothetical protein
VSEFVVQRGTIPLATWDLASGAEQIEAAATVVARHVVISETDQISFVLRDPNAAMEYNIFVGDVSLAEVLPNPIDAHGMMIQGNLIWRDFRYFDSARGATLVKIKCRDISSSEMGWQNVAEREIYVLPTKSGEAHYERMQNDLSSLSRSLITDLYGKSKHTYDILFARDMKGDLSKEEELDAVWSLVRRIGPLLTEMRNQPASRLVSESKTRQFWGSERIGIRGVRALSRKGIDIKSSPRPMNIEQSVLRESFDIHEHRAIVAFLDVITARCNLCAEAARSHMESIVAEKELRDITFNNGPSLYQTMDVPKLQRLEEGLKKADESLKAIKVFRRLPFLNRVCPDLAALRRMSIQPGSTYHVLWTLIQRYLTGGGTYAPGRTQESMTKLTTRLFEQWCFLRLVEAFRSNGLDLQEWDDSIRRHLRSRFVVDFDRGLRFSGRLDNGLRLNLHFEPWILGNESAIRQGNSLCRASDTNAAWSPDIVIECVAEHGSSWEPVYIIVMDSKYTARVSEYHWQGVMKYLQIRSTNTGRQVARQLWLISLDSPAGITPEDPAVKFTDSGPTVSLDDTIQCRLGVNFLQERETERESDVFAQFAKGTLAFLMRIGT